MNSWKLRCSLQQFDNNKSKKQSDKTPNAEADGKDRTFPVAHWTCFRRLSLSAYSGVMMQSREDETKKLRRTNDLRLRKKWAERVEYRVADGSDGG